MGKYHKKLVKPRPTYTDRNELLLTIGFKDYQQYLNSDLWKRIRENAWRELGRTCRLCPSTASEIHHVHYSLEALLGEDLNALVPLCRPCHESIEINRNGRKRSLWRTQKTYRRRLARIETLNKGCRNCGRKPKKGTELCTPCMLGVDPSTNRYPAPAVKKYRSRRIEELTDDEKREILRRVKVTCPENGYSALSREFRLVRFHLIKFVRSHRGKSLTPGMGVITREVLVAGMDAEGRLSKDQLDCLGIPYRLLNGWFKENIGREVPQSKIDEFLSLRRNREGRGDD